MEVESFEPSDEMMALVHERNRPVYEAAEARRRDLIRRFGPQAPIEFFPEPDPPGHFRTAYERNLRHERLILDLQLLGFRTFVRVGKQAECDRMVEEAIKYGREVELAASVVDAPYSGRKMWLEQLAHLQRQASGGNSKGSGA